MSNKRKIVLMILASSIIGGGVAAVTKIGLLTIPPFTFSFIRFLIATVVLIPFLRGAKIKINADFLKLMLISLLPVFNVVLYVLGLKLTTANISAVIYTATPILVAVFSSYLISHKMPIKKWLSVLLGFFGIAIVVFLPIVEKGIPFSGNLTGNFLMCIGVTLWSLYLTLSKIIQKKYSPIFIAFLFILEATVVFFFLSFTEIREQNTWWRELNSSSILALSYISLLATVGAYLLNQYKIKLANPLTASLAHYLMPVSGYIFAFFLLGEKLTAGLIVGTILVFTSIWLTLYKS